MISDMAVLTMGFHTGFWIYPPVSRELRSQNTGWPFKDSKPKRCDHH